ncbi:MAG: hypothetical protein QOC63_4994 [Mycobacterium sp.]|jgi:hypothetical protein|nr:hypothetical protein [Mycobacterium sp.]
MLAMYALTQIDLDDEALAEIMRIAGVAVGSCEPQRAEFRRSARNADEFDQMNQCRNPCGGAWIRRSTGSQAQVRYVPCRSSICWSAAPRLPAAQ